MKDESEANYDAPYFEKGAGIVQVPLERWEIAQAAEKSLWMKEGIFWDSDRNDSHKENFDNYRTLENRTFQRALEVGCGPFTNLRLIAKHACLQSVALLDPLINSYLSHPACRYTRHKLALDANWPGPTLKAILIRSYRVFPPLCRTIRNLFFLNNPKELIPLAALHDSSAEDAVFTNEHDLVVSINVFEHCFDVQKVLGSILSSMTKNSVLVLHERLYFDDCPLDYYDPYHPLRVHGDVIRIFLEKNFSALFDKTLSPDPAVGEHWPQLYYIGERRASTLGSVETDALS